VVERVAREDELVSDALAGLAQIDVRLRGVVLVEPDRGRRGTAARRVHAEQGAHRQRGQDTGADREIAHVVVSDRRSA